MTNKLTRSSDEKIFGVAAGLANHFNMDTTTMRAIWAIATIFIGPEVAFIYLLMALILPKADSTHSNVEPEIIVEKDPAAFA